MKHFLSRVPGLFLRLVICLVAVAAIAVCALKLPRMIMQEAAKTPETAWQVYLFLVGAYLQAALFLFGLCQAFKLLGYFEGENAFSELSVRAFRRLKCAAIGIGALMAAGIAWVLFLSAGTGDDSAGPVMIGFIGMVVSSLVAAAAAVLQALIQKGINSANRPM